MQPSLASSVFYHGGEIPGRYTCDGEDVSPPLQWSGVPAGTRSLALIVKERRPLVEIPWPMTDLPTAC